MITRIISAIIIALIFLPILFIGGNTFRLAALLLALISTYELLGAYKRKNLPTFMKIVTYVLVIILVLNNTFIGPFSSLDKFSMVLNIKLLLLIITLITLPIIFYHNLEKYNISDAAFLTYVILLIGIFFNMLIRLRLRNEGLELLFFAVLLAVLTDTGAYYSGMLFGKNKLIPEISPKKTIEGLIGGTLIGSVISAIYLSVINLDAIQLDFVEIFFYTILLSLLGQLGDLVFSSIKRRYKIKDFGNIIPGHGGVLDRLDNILFVVAGIMIILS